jgi:hypothetical protein
MSDIEHVLELPITTGNSRHRFSERITPVRAASSAQNARQVADVVEAFRRLHGNVLRFVQLLADPQRETAPLDAPAGGSIDQLLSLLVDRARAAGFTRLDELGLAVRHARSATQQRDVVFSPSNIGYGAALQRAAAELARLDAMFVGLCVEHVLDTHQPGAPRSDYAAGRRGAPMLSRSGRSRGTAARVKP